MFWNTRGLRAAKRRLCSGQRASSKGTARMPAIPASLGCPLWMRSSRPTSLPTKPPCQVQLALQPHPLSKQYHLRPHTMILQLPSMLSNQALLSLMQPTCLGRRHVQLRIVWCMQAPMMHICPMQSPSTGDRADPCIALRCCTRGQSTARHWWCSLAADGTGSTAAAGQSPISSRLQQKQPACLSRSPSRTDTQSAPCRHGPHPQSSVISS